VVSEMVSEEIGRHSAVLRGKTGPPRVQGKTTIIVDDGISSGYTMLAAVRYVRSLNPKSIVVAAPVASSQAAGLVEPEADKLVAITISHQIPFTVADFYLDWHRLSIEEVTSCRAASLRGRDGRI
jgi:putative phosphoribosyl transferase